MQVYKPEDYTISIGVPKDLVELLNLPIKPYIEIRDWVSITSNKPVQRFNFSNGIFGEPFVEMTNNTSRLFTLNILQASKDVKILRRLLLLQTFGEVGFPFSIFDSGESSNSIFDVDGQRQKSLYAVAWIVDEPQEAWTLQGATWAYQIQVSAGGTLYI